MAKIRKQKPIIIYKDRVPIMINHNETWQFFNTGGNYYQFYFAIWVDIIDSQEFGYYSVMEYGIYIIYMHVYRLLYISYRNIDYQIYKKN